MTNYMNDFLKELKKQWKHFTLKKLIICMIILCPGLFGSGATQ